MSIKLFKRYDNDSFRSELTSVIEIGAGIDLSQNATGQTRLDVVSSSILVNTLADPTDLLAGTLRFNGAVLTDNSGAVTIDYDARFAQLTALATSGGLSIHAANINLGTLSDTILSANVPLKNAANVFSAAQRINELLTIGRAAGQTFLEFVPTSGATSTSTNGEIRFWGDAAKTDPRYAWIRQINSGGLNQNDLAFGANYAAGNIEVMRIWNEGGNPRVGIGTTTGTSMLNIAGSLNVTTTSAFGGAATFANTVTVNGTEVDLIGARLIVRGISSFNTAISAGTIYGTSSTGEFPFNGAGHLVLQARPLSGRNIYFVTGATPTLRANINHVGIMSLASENDEVLRMHGPGNVYMTFYRNGTIGTSGARSGFIGFDTAATTFRFYNDQGGGFWFSHSGTGQTFDVNSMRIINVGAPTNTGDAATKGYVDSVGASKTQFSDIWDNFLVVGGVPTAVVGQVRQLQIGAGIAYTSQVADQYSNTITGRRVQIPATTINATAAPWSSKFTAFGDYIIYVSGGALDEGSQTYLATIDAVGASQFDIALYGDVILAVVTYQPAASPSPGFTNIRYGSNLNGITVNNADAPGGTSQLVDPYSAKLYGYTATGTRTERAVQYLADNTALWPVAGTMNLGRTESWGQRWNNVYAVGLNLTGEILIGGDVVVRRNAANILGTPDSFAVGDSLAVATSATVGTTLSVTGDTTISGASTVAALSATALAANRGGSLTAGGLSLNGATTNVTTYGIAYRQTSQWGTYGTVTGTQATYFTSDNVAGRGWIFRNGSDGTNIVSISNTGASQFAGAMTLLSTLSVGASVSVGTTLSVTGTSTVAALEATFLSANRGSSLTAGGISLNGAVANIGTYGIAYRQTSQLGTYGTVTGSAAVYFTMDNSANRGWIFRNGSSGVNVASISNTGATQFAGAMTLSSSLNFGTQLGQVINLYSNTYGLGIESGTMFFRAGGTFRWYINQSNDGVNWKMSLDDTALTLKTIALDMGASRILNVADPINLSDAATKSYVDSVGAGKTQFADVWDNFLVVGGHPQAVVGQVRQLFINAGIAYTNQVADQFGSTVLGRRVQIAATTINATAAPWNAIFTTFGDYIIYVSGGVLDENSQTYLATISAVRASNFDIELYGDVVLALVTYQPAASPSPGFTNIRYGKTLNGYTLTTGDKLVDSYTAKMYAYLDDSGPAYRSVMYFADDEAMWPASATLNLGRSDSWGARWNTVYASALNLTGAVTAASASFTGLVAAGSMTLGGNAVATQTWATTTFLAKTGGLLTGDLTIQATQPWLMVLGGAASTTYAGISVGESNLSSTAALRIVYRGDGYSWIGMGTANNAVPSQWTMQFNYQSNVVDFAATPRVAGVALSLSSHTHNPSEVGLSRYVNSPVLGNSGPYGSVRVTGSDGGYAGIQFADAATTLMVYSNGSSIYRQGFYRYTSQPTVGWEWYFENGVLTAGTVPVGRITGTLPASQIATTHTARHTFNGGIRLPDGTVSAPSLAIGQDDLGLWRYTTNGLGLAGAFYVTRNIAADWNIGARANDPHPAYMGLYGAPYTDGASWWRGGNAHYAMYVTADDLYLNASSVTGVVYLRQANDDIARFDGNGLYLDKGWFRNVTNGLGLYNQANSYYWYADSTVGRWVSRSGSGIQLRDTGNNIRGWVHFDATNFGLLYAGGGWAVRANVNETVLYGGGNVSTYAASEGAFTMTRTTGSRYPYIEWKYGSTRGAYMGWGTPGTYLDLVLEANNTFRIGGGDVQIETNLEVWGDLKDENGTKFLKGRVETYAPTTEPGEVGDLWFVR